MFSYNKGAEKNNNNEITLLKEYRKYRGVTKYAYAKKHVNKQLQNRSYITSILLDKNGKGNPIPLNYDNLQEQKIKDDINYKNSFVLKAYDNILNATPIFITITLPSEYHPFTENGKRVNPNFFNDVDLELFDTLEDYLNHYDKMVLEGYIKLNEFERDFYKQEIFKNKRLNSSNRARITAFEPHDSLVPHLHKLEVVNGYYLFEYIQTLMKRHRKDNLGRTEVVLLKRSFDEIKNLLNKKIGIKRVSKDKYVSKDNPQFYFRLIEDRSDDEIRTVSNYMTSYLETNTIVVEDNKTETKKPSNIYNGWAYYIAELKDKFYPKDNGKNHKKIMRIRYSNLLVSKEVYRSIFTKEVKQHLKSNGMYQKRNMYARITDLINNEDIKIYRAYKYKDEVDENGEVTTVVDKSKVMWYKVEINHEDRKDKYHSFMIDKCSNKLYRKRDNGELELLNKSEQIDLKKPNEYYFDRYRFQTDREHILFDDELMEIVAEYIKREKEKLQKE